MARGIFGFSNKKNDYYAEEKINAQKQNSDVEDEWFSVMQVSNAKKENYETVIKKSGIDYNFFENENGWALSVRRKDVQKWHEEIERECDQYHYEQQTRKTKIVPFPPELKEKFEKKLSQNNLWFQFVNNGGHDELEFNLSDIESIETIYDSIISEDEKRKREEKNQLSKNENYGPVVYDVSEKEEAPRKKTTRKKLNRNRQLMARFTDKEYEIVEKKIEASGKRQGDFIRDMLLNGKVKAFPSTVEHMESIDVLKNTQSSLGKIGGLLTKAIKPSEKNPDITKEDMDLIKNEIKELKKIKSEIKKVVDVWR